MSQRAHEQREMLARMVMARAGDCEHPPFRQRPVSQFSKSLILRRRQVQFFAQLREPRILCR